MSPPEVAALVVGPGGVVDEEAGGLGPGGHVGQRVGHRLEVGDGAAERPPLARHGPRPGRAPLRPSPRRRRRRSGGTGPASAWPPGSRRSTSPRTSPGPTGHAVEDEPADGVGGEHLDRLAGEAGGVAGHDEGGDAPGAGVGGGAGEDGVEVGVGGVGDPGLLPCQAPAVAVGFGGQGQGGGVGARPRLRQGEGRHRLAPGDRRHEPAGQLRGARLDQRVRAEALEGERRLGLGALPGQRLPEPAQLGGRHPVAARPAERRGEQPAEQRRSPPAPGPAAG